jgi:hypothetical protein
MKLYTQEQLIKYVLEHGYIDIDVIILELTPIELPTDKEIREVIKPFQNEMDDFDLGFRNGVQWLREKIQGDNI